MRSLEANYSVTTLGGNSAARRGEVGVRSQDAATPRTPSRMLKVELPNHPMLFEEGREVCLCVLHSLVRVMDQARSRVPLRARPIKGHDSQPTRQGSFSGPSPQSNHAHLGGSSDSSRIPLTRATRRSAGPARIKPWPSPTHSGPQSVCRLHCRFHRPVELGS